MLDSAPLKLLGAIIAFVVALAAFGQAVEWIYGKRGPTRTVMTAVANRYPRLSLLAMISIGALVGGTFSGYAWQRLTRESPSMLASDAVRNRQRLLKLEADLKAVDAFLAQSASLFDRLKSTRESYPNSLLAEASAWADRVRIYLKGNLPEHSTRFEVFAGVRLEGVMIRSYGLEVKEALTILANRQYQLERIATDLRAQQSSGDTTARPD